MWPYRGLNMTDRACVCERLLEGTPDYNEWWWRSQRSEEALPQSMHRPLPSVSFISEKSSSTIFLHSLKESIESLRATFFQTWLFSLSNESRGISMERTRPRLIVSHYFYYVQYTGVEWFLLIHIDTIERYHIICTSHITYSRIWKRGGVSTKQISTIFSLLAKKMTLSRALEEITDTDCTKWRTSISDKDIEKKDAMCYTFDHIDRCTLSG